MKLDRRVVALGAVAALTFGMPTAAHAGSSSKGKAGQHQQKAASKAEAARKKAEAARKKAEQARWHAAYPGSVSAVGATTVTITRKAKGVTESRTLELAPGAVVKLAGQRVALSAVQVGDHVVAHVRRVDGAVKVVKLNVERVVAPAPVVPDTATATILI